MSQEIKSAAAPDYSRLLRLIADGSTISDACRQAGIDRNRFYADIKGIPDLRQQLKVAQELGAEAMADTLANIHATVRDPLMARVVSENRKWLLSKRASERFGDHIGKNDNVSNDLTAILKEAVARIPLPDRDPAPMIEAENVTISDILGDETA